MLEKATYNPVLPHEILRYHYHVHNPVDALEISNPMNHIDDEFNPMRPIDVMLSNLYHEIKHDRFVFTQFFGQPIVSPSLESYEITDKDRLNKQTLFKSILVGHNPHTNTTILMVTKFHLFYNAYNKQAYPELVSEIENILISQDTEFILNVYDRETAWLSILDPERVARLVTHFCSKYYSSHPGELNLRLEDIFYDVK